MIIIFDWLGDIISGIGDAIGNAIDVVESGIANAIWNAMLRWIYEIIYGAIADCFEMIGGMSAEVFDLEWVQATVKLFTLFGWGLFVAGTVVAVFDVAIEYQCGRANIKTTALNILKGFFACSLIGVVPIELYKFCISLQNTFSHDLIGIASSGINSSLADVGLNALVRLFSPSIGTTFSLLNLLCMIAFAYCVIKMFFANAIDFVRKFYNKNYPEAMEYLLNGYGGTLTAALPIEQKGKAFNLPEKNDNMRRVLTERTLLQKSVAMFKVKTELISAVFLKCCYDANPEMYTVKSASAQPNLLLSRINSTQIYLPPIELQRQFAAFVEQVDKSKFEIQQSLEKLEILKKSLMQQYFG